MSSGTETSGSSNLPPVVDPAHVDHIGFAVPDMDQALKFFVDVMGCEHLYDLGPFSDPNGTWMQDNLDVHPEARINRIAILRGPGGVSFEIFDYESPDQVKHWPRMSDYGGFHIAFYVPDMRVALTALRERGVRLLGEAKDGIGPESGKESYFAHFLTPWGQVLEYVSYPNGRLYQESAATGS